MGAKCCLATPKTIEKNKKFINSHFFIPKFSIVLIKIIQLYYIDCCLGCFYTETIVRISKSRINISDFHITIDWQLSSSDPFTTSVIKSFLDSNIEIPSKIKTMVSLTSNSVPDQCRDFFVAMTWNTSTNNPFTEWNLATVKTAIKHFDFYQVLTSRLVHGYQRDGEHFQCLYSNNLWLIDQVFKIVYLRMNALFATGTS